MSFWSSETLKKKLNQIVTPAFEKNIKHGAYELGLGSTYFMTDLTPPVANTIAPKQQLTIKPGQFALLQTDEIISIPSNALGLISIKAGIKFRGLINVSGFHVDPGFHGYLKFSVFNAGSNTINLTQGAPTFLLWLSDLDTKTSDTYQCNDTQNIISSKDVMSIQGDIAAPSELRTRIEKLERDRWIFATVISALIVGTITYIVKNC